MMPEWLTSRTTLAFLVGAPFWGSLGLLLASLMFVARRADRPRPRPARRCTDDLPCWHPGDCTHTCLMLEEPLDREMEAEAAEEVDGILEPRVRPHGEIDELDCWT